MLNVYEFSGKHPPILPLLFQTSEGLFEKISTYGGCKMPFSVQTSERSFNYDTNNNGKDEGQRNILPTLAKPKTKEK